MVVTSLISQFHMGCLTRDSGYVANFNYEILRVCVSEKCSSIFQPTTKNALILTGEWVELGWQLPASRYRGGGQGRLSS